MLLCSVYLFFGTMLSVLRYSICNGTTHTHTREIRIMFLYELKLCSSVQIIDVGMLFKADAISKR